MQYFKNIQEELISRINNSAMGLKIAVTWFTNHDIFESILKKLETPGYQVDLIVLNDRINNKKEGVDFQKLINCGGNFYYSVISNMVHHKFCIIDDKVVITGSYNWTYYAENRNWENIVVLNSTESVKAYRLEFNRLLESHSKVIDVSTSSMLSNSIDSEQYVISDYMYQAQNERKKGNDMAAVKIYNELLKLDNKNVEVQNVRSDVLSQLDAQGLTICPFEIGIKFKSGYKTVIAAFSELPITKKMNGTTSTDNATSLKVTIQKNDYTKQTLVEFSLDNIKPSPRGTVKIEHTLFINQHGVLTVIAREINGYGRTNFKRVNLRSFI